MRVSVVVYLYQFSPTPSFTYRESHKAHIIARDGRDIVRITVTAGAGTLHLPGVSIDSPLFCGILFRQGHRGGGGGRRGEDERHLQGEVERREYHLGQGRKGEG